MLNGDDDRELEPAPVEEACQDHVSYVEAHQGQKTVRSHRLRNEQIFSFHTHEQRDQQRQELCEQLQAESDHLHHSVVALYFLLLFTLNQYEALLDIRIAVAVTRNFWVAIGAHHLVFCHVCTFAVEDGGIALIFVLFDGPVFTDPIERITKNFCVDEA